MFRSGYVGDFSGNPRCLCVNVICMASELQQLVMHTVAGEQNFGVAYVRHRHEGMRFHRKTLAAFLLP